jgi:hypothetical protein
VPGPHLAKPGEQPKRGDDMIGLIHVAYEREWAIATIHVEGGPRLRVVLKVRNARRV